MGKRFWTVLLTLLLALLLWGCNQQEEVYTVTKNGTEFCVDTIQKTISDGSNTYRYGFSGDSSSFNAKITYPDGSSYWYNQSGSSGSGGWSDNYEEGKYASGDVLVDILQENAPKRTQHGNILIALLLIALGIVDIAAPQVSWYLGYGWRYKDAEPSDAALIFARIGGIAAVVLGCILLWI